MFPYDDPAANDAYKSKKYALAASMYKKIIKKTESPNPKLLKNYAMASLKLDSFDVAKAYFDLALANCSTAQVRHTVAFS